MRVDVELFVRDDTEIKAAMVSGRDCVLRFNGNNNLGDDVCIYFRSAASMFRVSCAILEAMEKAKLLSVKQDAQAQ